LFTHFWVGVLRGMSYYTYDWQLGFLCWKGAHPSPTPNQKIKINLSPPPLNKIKKRLSHSPPQTKKLKIKTKSSPTKEKENPTKKSQAKLWSYYSVCSNACTLIGERGNVAGLIRVLWPFTFSLSQSLFCAIFF